jgi:DNA-binding MarR family transcriptional regulator
VVKATAIAEKGLRPAPPEGGRALGLQRTGSYESEAFYTHRLSLLSRLIARETRQMLAEPFGLSQMDWRVLIQLEHVSPSKISEIHSRSLLAKPQISSALPPLIKSGYVVREEDPEDARAPFFSITEKGLQLYRSVMRLSRKRQRRLELLLSESERATFSKAIDKLISALLAEAPAGDQLNQE